MERTGATLRSKVPLTNLTCEQGAEMLSTCTKTSVVYENVFAMCNPEAGAKELGGIKDDVPTLYIGKSSRTIF